MELAMREIPEEILPHIDTIKKVVKDMELMKSV